MSKRDSDVITLGSGKAYMMEFSGTLPELTAICAEENLLGWIKGGAALSYTESTYTEKDDLGKVMKIITTEEEAKLKLGLITWNGNTLSKLTDRAAVSEKDGKRTLKIGGATHGKNKNYVVCFHHEDKEDGDVWIMIVGRNTAGLSLSFSMTAGSQVDPEFTAVPQDNDGTLVQFIEEIPSGTPEQNPSV